MSPKEARWCAAARATRRLAAEKRRQRWREDIATALATIHGPLTVDSVLDALMDRLTTHVAEREFSRGYTAALRTEARKLWALNHRDDVQGLVRGLSGRRISEEELVGTISVFVNDLLKARAA